MWSNLVFKTIDDDHRMAVTTTMLDAFAPGTDMYINKKPGACVWFKGYNIIIVLSVLSRKLYRRLRAETSEIG